MAIKHYNVTIGAAAKPISTTRKGILQATIQNTSGNSAIFIGDSTVTGTVYGHTLAASAILTIGPFIGAAPLSTDEVYLAGTTNDVVHRARR